MATHNPADRPSDRPRVQADPSYTVADLVIDVRRERVTRNGREIPLPKLSFDLFAALVKAAPELVTIDSLMQAVWPRLVVGPETVVQRVKLLRQALGDDSKQPRYVASVRGRGYRIVPPIGPVDSLDARAVSAPAPPTSVAASPRGFAATLSRRMLAGIAAVVAILIAGGAFVALKPAEHLAAAPRVAVLPFENLSPSTEYAFFAEGLHDEVISVLAERAPSLDVIASTTMMTLRDRPPAAAHVIAGELGATDVIAGTVWRDADRVRLTVQLVDPRTDSAIWSRTYDRAAVDARGLRSEVVADLTARLSPKTAEPAPPHPANTRSSEAYDLYLKALVARMAASGVYSRSPAAIEAVEGPLTRAIELDPSFAEAYAERAVIRLAKVFYNLDASDSQLELGNEDVEAAERLAPGAPKTLAARAYDLLVRTDFDGALAKFTAAEAAGLADPLWMLDATTIVTDRRSPAEALQDAERVVAIDPRNPVSVSVYAAHLLAAHRPTDAVHALDLGLATSPGDVSLAGLRKFAVFGATGRTMPATISPEQAVTASVPDLPPDARALAQAFDGARWSGGIGELAKQLATIATRDVRGGAPGVGHEPVARYRGWAELLAGDAGAAAADGRAILEFLAATTETPRNALFRRMLEAEAYTFVGDSARAIDAARTAARMPRGTDLLSRRDKVIAAIYAWNRDFDDAVDALERLATGVPGIGPAEIARDPWYTIALAHDARFQRLAARLEEQMRATPIQ